MQLNELMKVIISPVDVNLYGENGFKERIPFEEAKLRTDISVRRVSISYEGYHQFLNVMEDAPKEADIAKIMTISMAHIKSDTILRSHNSNVTIFSKGMYGWFVYVPEYDIRECGTCPNELLDVLDYAREEGCTWLLLDSDGPIINELPTYEWTAPVRTYNFNLNRNPKSEERSSTSYTSRSDYKEIRDSVEEIDHKIADGCKFSIVSISKWENVYRKEILSLLDVNKSVSKENQDRIMQILALLLKDLEAKADHEQEEEANITVSTLEKIAAMDGLNDGMDIFASRNTGKADS